MVQYIITPWRNRQELLSVRRAFYPSSETRKANRDKDRHEAVERVSVWVQRGNCPHSVESTALLVSAMLNEAAGTSAYAMRAAYSTAFSR
jgi:Las1-like